MAELAPATIARVLGRSFEPPLPDDAKDSRFTDEAWSRNPGFFALRQSYLAVGKLGHQLLAIGAKDSVTDGKARLAWDFIMDAVAPTNFLLTNPAALRRALETGGRSVVAGLSNFAADVRDNGGRPRQVDTTP